MHIRDSMCEIRNHKYAPTYCPLNLDYEVLLNDAQQSCQLFLTTLAEEVYCGVDPSGLGAVHCFLQGSCLKILLGRSRSDVESAGAEMLTLQNVVLTKTVSMLRLLGYFTLNDLICFTEAST